MSSLGAQSIMLVFVMRQFNSFSSLLTDITSKNEGQMALNDGGNQGVAGCSNQVFGAKLILQCEAAI